MACASYFILLLITVFCFTKGHCHVRVFKLEDYGAVEGGKEDVSKALLQAWVDACTFEGEARLEISSGTYFVKPVLLTGPCNGRITFMNRGHLKAPKGATGTDYWISFRYIDGLTLDGGGSFEGGGPPDHGSPHFPTLLRFSFVTNSKVQNMKLMNSMTTHFHLFACNNTDIRKISISSPGDSPNTDGIKMGICQGITITDSKIVSGDDCVALLTGSRNITIERVFCGPGHGISIGSLGGSDNNDLVEHVTVSNCSFFGTLNGVRIKTKASPYTGMVSNIRYKDLFMHGIDNPIIIDQNYCPSRTCSQGDSQIKIRDVEYINIKGKSRAEVAINLQCSENNPCEGIKLEDIDLTYNKNGGHTISKCSNVNGISSGIQIPKGCI